MRAPGAAHPRGWAAVVAAVAVRPGLWPTALRQLRRTARPGWWRRWPPLPVPDPDYLRFRLTTAYGEGGRAPAAGEVVSYLRWCRRQDRRRER